MSINHQALQIALRELAETVTVVTTGSTTLGATGLTYTRPAGSFLTDGFAPGMETTDWSGRLRVVKSVAALTLTVDDTIPTSAEAAGRTLSVGLPSRFAFENVHFEATTSAPWVEEELVSGPNSLLTTAENGTMQFDPLYNLWIHVPENQGVGAHNRYADALLALLSPNTAITLSDGNVARVRTDASSYRGPMRRTRAGFASVRVTFPLRLYLINN